MAMDAITRRVIERIDDRLDRRHVRNTTVLGLTIPIGIVITSAMGT